MTRRLTTVLAGLGFALGTACSTPSNDGPGNSVPPEQTPAPEEGPPVDEPTEPAALTNAECTAKGGQVVGDIGDGAIHKPDYVCPSGSPPMAKIQPGPDEPIAVEGSVCCPAAT